MSLLGLDIGLSGCRALVVSTDGTLLADIGRGYGPTAHVDACELDMRSIWASIAAVLREAAQRTHADPVDALAISSVGDAIVPLSRDGSVLAGCLVVANDTDDQTLAQLLAKYGQERVYDITGQVPNRTTTFSRLCVLRRMQPELYGSTWRFAPIGGIVSHLLGGATTCDYSLAGGTLCFDLHQKAWSREILASCGLSPAKMPVLAEAGTPLGTISGRVAQELQLPPRLTIVLGGHDLACQALGVGALDDGMAVLSLGAAVHLTAVFHPVPLLSLFLREGVNIERHVDSELLLADSSVRAGGAWLRWFCNEITPVEQRESARRGVSLYRTLLEEMPEAPSPLLVQPPHASDAIRAGTIQGLTLETTRGELTKGMLEGVALQNAQLQHRLASRGLPIARYRLAGGGARTDGWASLCADVLGRPVERPAIAPSAALGAAILAGLGIGTFDTLQEGVRSLVQIDRLFEPDAGRHRIYRERLQAIETFSGART